MFQTQKEVKTAVSTLRRELEALGLPKAKLSHTQGLELFARMAQKGSYAELLPTLTDSATPKQPARQMLIDAELLLELLEGAIERAPDRRDVVHENVFGDYTEEDTAGADSQAEKMLAIGETLRPQIEAALAGTPAPVEKSYRLINQGEFDLAEDGVLVDGRDFADVTATVETIPECTAGIASVTREGREVVVDYDGATDVNWDGQKTDKDARGFKIFQDDNGNQVTEDVVIVVPEDFDPTDPDLPVRDVLVTAYADYLAAHPGSIEAAKSALGLALTDVEVEALKAKLI